MSEALNEIHAYFGKLNTTTTAPVKQWAYGQKLVIHDADLPNIFEAYYSNSRSRGEASPQIGTDGVVDAPHEFFRSGADIYVFLMVHEGQDDGRYNKIVHIPIDPCAEPSDVEPEPYEQSVIDQAIAALNDAVTQTGEDKAATAALAEAAAASSLIATEAAQSAQGSATSASGSASTASTAAATATTKASEAATSAANAQAAEHAIKDMTVSSQTLEAGYQATVTKTEDEGTFNLNFGIPQGEKGEGAFNITSEEPLILIQTDADGKVTSDFYFSIVLHCYKGDEELAYSQPTANSFPLAGGGSVSPNYAQMIGSKYWQCYYRIYANSVPKNVAGIIYVSLTIDGTTYGFGQPYALVKQGIQGDTGNGIASIEKTGTSGLVDTYTITFDDGTTETYEVTNGADGDDYVLTAADKQKIAAEVSDMFVVEVTGRTPTITAQANTRYVCGELDTLDFTPSATGICDVIFTSGTTATVLTLPSTVKMPSGFSVAADTVYELNFLAGLGVYQTWAST